MHPTPTKKIAACRPQTAYAEWTMLLSPEKYKAFDRGRELCLAAIELSGQHFEPVKIPYQGVELEGMFWPANGGGKRPTAVKVRRG